MTTFGICSRMLGSACAAALLLGSTPCLASDVTTGVVAGLGLTVATGKTTTGGGAGTIEAGILGSDAFQKAGAIIASVMNATAGGRRIVLLAHDEVLNLSQPELVRQRIAAVTALYTNIQCKDAAPGKGAITKGEEALLTVPSFLGGGTFSAKDVVAALATDTSISQITLNVDDRLLIDSILMNGAARAYEPASDWKTGAQDIPSATGAQFIVPSDAIMVPHGDGLYAQYTALLALESKKRGEGCDSTAIKAAFTTTDALVSSLNAPGDKGAPTPLINAIQLEEIGKQSPLVLRVAIEQAGGTSITRSGVIYTLGLDSSALVSSGLLVTFRLSDPANGQMKALGVVRCALKPTDLLKVQATIASQNGTVCSYKAATG